MALSYELKDFTTFILFYIIKNLKHTHWNQLGIERVFTDNFWDNLIGIKEEL